MIRPTKILLYFGFLSLFLYINHGNILAEIVTKSYVKTYKVECDLNPKYVDNVTCKLQTNSWTSAFLTFSCDLRVPIRNLSFNAALYKLYNEFRPYYINFTMNACSFLDKKVNVFHARIMYKYLRPVSNLNHSCPYEGTIFVKGVELNESYVPGGFAMLFGKYKTTLKFTEGYPPVDLGSISVYAEAFEKRIKKSG